MAWFCSGTTNTELIENLWNAGLIKDMRVKKAMLGVSTPCHSNTSISSV
jgi:protein-L-isoaspartate(D-aspartate) O-methyltransferase